jgi:heptosyltransferase-2
MQNAVMNYVNDSAPLHLASAVNANVAAIFCSTIPGFGFGPLSQNSVVIETQQKLPCRPCGLHGKKQCPEGHFNCAETIEIEQLLQQLPCTPKK